MQAGELVLGVDNRDEYFAVTDLEDRRVDFVGVLIEHRRDHDRAPRPFLGLR